METGLAWLTAQRREHMARTVTYMRGDVAVDVVATLGRSVFTQHDSGRGAAIRSYSRDFIVSASDLVLDGEQTMPRPGDVIKDQRDGELRVFTVSPFGGEPCYRFTSASESVVRIHTRRSGTE